MKKLLVLGILGLTWQGLFLGATQSQDWHKPLLPGWSAITYAMVGRGRVSFTLGYTYPLDVKPPTGASVQAGVTIRLF